MEPFPPEPPGRRVARTRRRRLWVDATGAALGLSRVGVWVLVLLGWLLVTAVVVVVGVLLLVSWAAQNGWLPENPPP